MIGRESLPEPDPRRTNLVSFPVRLQHSLIIPEGISRLGSRRLGVRRGNMTGTGNMFTGVMPNRAMEVFTTLLAQPGLRIERIVSAGHASPPGVWLDQPHGEWVLVLDGAAALEIEGMEGLQRLGAGDYVWLPPHCRHRVAWTDAGRATVWLAVHVGERE
jgi:cupin 2 domain-containing protein